LKAIEMEMIARVKEGVKERQALDVVPMVVRHQNLRFDVAVTMRLHPLVAEHAESSAAIEDEARAVGSGDFDAGGVAAVAPRVPIERGSGAAHPPEDHFGVSRHVLERA